MAKNRNFTNNVVLSVVGEIAYLRQLSSARDNADFFAVLAIDG